MLAGTVIAIGGGISFAYFYYSPFLYVTNTQDRSRFLAILLFLVVALITTYLASRTRRDAAAAVKRENEIRERRPSRANSGLSVRSTLSLGRKIKVWWLLGRIFSLPCFGLDPLEACATLICSEHEIGVKVRTDRIPAKILRSAHPFCRGVPISEIVNLQLNHIFIRV
jgi:hypothetical protein